MGGFENFFGGSEGLNPDPPLEDVDAAHTCHTPQCEAILPVERPWFVGCEKPLKTTELEIFQAAFSDITFETHIFFDIAKQTNIRVDPAFGAHHAQEPDKSRNWWTTDPWILDHC